MVPRHPRLRGDQQALLNITGHEITNGPGSLSGHRVIQALRRATQLQLTRNSHRAEKCLHMTVILCEEEDLRNVDDSHQVHATLRRWLQ